MSLFLGILFLIIFNMKGKLNLEIFSQHIVRSGSKKEKDKLEQKDIEREKNILSQRKMGLKKPGKNSSH